LCFTPPHVEVAVSPLPAHANGYVTFGCFNNLSKMNDGVVALWSRVLQSVPGSRLFLKSKQLGEASLRQLTQERFAAHGIAAERLLLEGAESREKYFAAYQRVDIALDPFPYPGGTTTVESLWMGVPVLNLAGQSFLFRQGAGFLTNAGLPEWIANSRDDYVQRVVMQAANLPQLAELRMHLRQQVEASPIMDGKRFADHFAVAMQEMWRVERQERSNV
jgi:predicted O-linked N-acetylglucosamine transferase (SPINDLY family)